MILRMIKAAMGGLKAGFVGYSECLGIFRITDHGGQPLKGVRVCYRVADGDWLPCMESFSGSNSSRAVPEGVNFVQASSISCPPEGTVSWKFCKPGFADKTLTHSANDHAEGKVSWRVVLFREDSGEFDGREKSPAG